MRHAGVEATINRAEHAMRVKSLSLLIAAALGLAPVLALAQDAPQGAQASDAVAAGDRL